MVNGKDHAKYVETANNVRYTPLLSLSGKLSSVQLRGNRRTCNGSEYYSSVLEFFIEIFVIYVEYCRH